MIWEMFVDGKNGSDVADGRSWATAKKTLQAAHDAAIPGSTVRLGEMHPVVGQGVVITKPLAIIGTSMGRAPGVGPAIRPLTPTSTVISVRASNCTLENLLVWVGSDFTGIGVDAVNAHGLILRNVTYQGVEDADSNKVFGGTGFRFEKTERASLSDVTAQNANVGLRIGHEGACGHAVNFAGIQNHQDLVATDNAGGWHWVKMKNTNSGKPGDLTPVVHLGPQSGNHLFEAADWCEAAPNRVLIESDHNTFVRPISAPGSEWHILGDHNHFYGARTLGSDWHFDGNYNRVDGGNWLSAIKGTGKRNRFSNVRGRLLAYQGSEPYYDNSSFQTVTNAGTGVLGRVYPWAA